MGTTFVERPAVDPELDGQTMIAAGRENPRFRFDGPLLNHYQLHFLRKSVELGVLHHIPVVMQHLPSPAELGQDFTPWQRNTAELFGVRRQYDAGGHLVRGPVPEDSRRPENRLLHGRAHERKRPKAVHQGDSAGAGEGI
jgi:hypothetical protein